MSGRGFVYAATGAGYVDLAVASARSLRAQTPDAEIDLFTDVECGADVFTRVVRLEDPWRRSKIDAMIRSRFERTVFLDCDTYVLLPLDDVFDLLDRFDLALAHDPWRAHPENSIFWNVALPNVFPQFNSGVIAFTDRPAVRDLFRRWRQVVLEEDHKRDQRSLRELLWASDLRLATLPPEYNLLDYTQIGWWRHVHAAPRVVHTPLLHRHFTAGGMRFASLEALLGPRLLARLPFLVATDHSLAYFGDRFAPRPGPWDARRLRRAVAAARLRGLVARVRRRFGGWFDQRVGPNPATTPSHKRADRRNE